MDLSVLKTQDLKSDYVDQIKNYVPWQWLKSSILDYHTDDIWVQFANQNNSVLLLDQELLQSYCVIWQSGKFHEVICKWLWVDQQDSISLMYLFTPEYLQNKWNAYQLLTMVSEYIRQRMSNIKQILRSTSSDVNKDYYINYWAEIINLLDKSSVEEFGICNDYFFIYKL